MVDWACWSAVNTVLQRFADAFDRADLAAMMLLFDPDAVWDHEPGHMLRGRAEIGDFLSRRFAGYAQTSHHVGPPVVSEGAAPSTVDSIAYMVAAHVLRTGESYTGYGRYVTALRDSGLGMLITRHAVVAHVTRGVSLPVNQLVRML